MKTPSTIFSLAVLATLSLPALAPTQAFAWGRGGYGGERFEGGYRSMGHFGRSTFSQACEGLASRSFAPMRQSYAPMRQQGYASPMRMSGRAFSPRDSYEDGPEIDSAMPAKQSDPDNAPAAYASKELQK